MVVRLHRADRFEPTELEWGLLSVGSGRSRLVVDVDEDTRIKLDVVCAFDGVSRMVIMRRALGMYFTYVRELAERDGLLDEE